MATTDAEATTMATIHHQLWIDAPLTTVFDGLASAEGLGRWWIPHQQTQHDGDTILSHNPGPEHGPVALKVLEVTPGHCVRWEVISRHPPQSPASAWTGTEVRFDLSRRASPGDWRGLPHEGEPMTVLEFHHLGWDPHSEYYGFCSQAWAETLVMLRRWAEAQTHRHR
ncbi:hypothetical protein [Stenotrophomonas sp. SY1]|uniref:hypothetical protein n=1 Tax=Stenotrophomonas sp. SY1 TaxID=477235 RepID=UPI001E4AD0D0|nr:hypothetical protein [Stenotrophomonas sp. SY1]MCD9086730.1 hypothetical protein [Stenotrophomonas sp. SY1]